jgi:hypothetical protein
MGPMEVVVEGAGAKKILQKRVNTTYVRPKNLV